MKTLLLFLLIAGGVALFIHDRQQTADLTALKAQNSQIAQELAEKQAALTAAQRTSGNWDAASTLAAPPASTAASSRASKGNTWTLKDNGGLNRGSY